MLYLSQKCSLEEGTASGIKSEFLQKNTKYLYNITEKFKHDGSVFLVSVLVISFLFSFFYSFADHLFHRVCLWIVDFLHSSTCSIFSRPYWVVRSRLWYDVLSVCRLSVTFCIVAERYVVEGRRWYRWIGR